MISTHAPRTGSDADVLLRRQRQNISTHAPRTGSDSPVFARRLTATVFQPTLPARGATERFPSIRAYPHDFNPRSPHGERRVLG